MNSRNKFPWFLHLQLTKMMTFLLLIIFLMFFLYNRYSHQIEISPLTQFVSNYPLSTYWFLFLLSFGFVFISFYVVLKPLENIMAKIHLFNSQIPLKKNLQLTAQQNEWALLEAALDANVEMIHQHGQELKEESLKSHTILESIEDSLVAFDLFETLLFYNENFAKKFILNKQKKTLISKAWHFFNEDISEAFRKVARTGHSVLLKSQFFSHHPSHFFDLNITPLKDDQGKIKGALGIFHDITQFKLTEQMRTDFIANVSHEIRTPLTSIRGFTQIIKSEQSQIPSHLHFFLDKIINNTERMISLFNDLLDLSAIENNHLDELSNEKKNDHHLLRTDKIHLSKMLNTITDHLKSKYSDKKITLHSQLNVSEIFIRPRLLEIILMNLFENAAKYSPNDVYIHFSSLAELNTLVLKISDQGMGIEKKHLSRIFERFYRIDCSRESLRGTGLGLSIVKQIVLKHQGEISADSQGPHKGTTFTIKLPFSSEVTT